MKKEDLYEGFGGLDDELLERSEKETGAIKKKRLSKMVKMGGLAACLILAVGMGVFFINSYKTVGTENDEMEEFGKSTIFQWL